MDRRQLISRLSIPSCLITSAVCFAIHWQLLPVSPWTHRSRRCYAVVIAHSSVRLLLGNLYRWGDLGSVWGKYDAVRQHSCQGRIEEEKALQCRDTETQKVKYTHCGLTSRISCTDKRQLSQPSASMPYYPKVLLVFSYNNMAPVFQWTPQSWKSPILTSFASSKSALCVWNFCEVIDDTCCQVLLKVL